MGFEFDQRKNIENKKNHGIELSEAQKLWKKDFIVIPAKNASGENRWAILGELRNKIHICIFTLRVPNKARGLALLFMKERKNG